MIKMFIAVLFAINFLIGQDCEEFITGCCGIEAFDIMEECLDFCE